MSQISDEHIKKLSDAITENNEIITEVNSLIKEMKVVKDINDANIEKYRKESNELIEDLDTIIDVMEACQQEDDPTFKSFDSKKKAAKSNSEKSKKLLLDSLSKLEKTLQKNKETEAKKTKGILKNPPKKDEEEANKKKTDKDKKKDPDTQSSKSAAGSSVVEDLEEVEEDLVSEFEEEDKDKAIESKEKEEDKNSKSSKGKNKENLKNDNEKDKKGKKSKEKAKKLDDTNSDSKNKNQQDDENEENVSGEEGEKKKSNKPSKLKGIKLPKGDKKKAKENNSEGDDKSKRSDDNDRVSVTNEEDLENEEKDKKKKKKEKVTKEKDKNEDSLKEEKPIKAMRKKKTVPSNDDDNETKNDTQKIDDTDEKPSEKEKKKKDKHDKESKKSDDNQSLNDNDGGSKSKSEKKHKDKKSDGEKTEDKKKKDKEAANGSDVEEESGKLPKKKDKSIKEKPGKKSSEKDKKKESGKEIVDSDKELRTPSIRTQESMKSESDFYDDFESDEEDNNKESVVMRKSATTESKIPETHSKPTTSLTRQGVVDLDDNLTSKKSEGELVSSTTFENIDGFYVATKTLDAEGEDDLSVKEGEQLTILEIDEDGWWLARNAKGDEGFVPMSCLKSMRDSRDLLDSKNVKDIEDTTIIPKETKPEFKEASDEGAQLWAQIQQTLKEKGISDVLKAFGALPAGFRFSTLASWNSKNPIECSMRASLYPKLSDSDLSFRDLQYDSVENKIRPRPVRIQRIVQIVKSFQMSATSDKFIPISRHVRMCLFNGEKAISNIHTMRATVTEKDLKTWNFNSRIADSTNSLEFNEIFIRTNHSSTEISLLLEFCMLGFKSKNVVATNPEEGNVPRKSTSIKVVEEFTDDELVEFSTGWARIPLYEENGQLITNKNADYELYGGTPFEEGLEVDPSIGRTAAGSKLRTLMNQSKQPQVSVRISLPSKDNKDLMETLPDVIIGSTLHLTNLSFYRRILSDELMDRRQNLTSAEPIYSPFLVSFLDVADQPDILDVMRTIWNDKMKTMKNLDKKDYGKMNKVYQDVYMEYIYPLSKIKSLPPASMGHQDAEQMRSVKIKEFVQRVKVDKLSVLLSGDYSFAPLSFEEFSYKVVSKYSKPLKA